MATEYKNKGPIYLTQAQYDALATKVVGQEYCIIDEPWIEATSIALTYSSESTYDLGAIVNYEGKIYKCTTAITTAEEFNSDNWEEFGKLAELINSTNEYLRDFIPGINYLPLVYNKVYKLTKETDVYSDLSGDGLTYDSSNKYWKASGEFTITFPNTSNYYILFGLLKVYFSTEVTVEDDTYTIETTDKQLIIKINNSNSATINFNKATLLNYIVVTEELSTNDIPGDVDGEMLIFK